MIELKKLSADDGMDVYTMLQEIPKEENLKLLAPEKDHKKKTG